MEGIEILANTWEIKDAIARATQAEADDVQAMEAHYHEHQRALKASGVSVNSVAMLNGMVAEVEAVKVRHREARQMLEKQLRDIQANCPHFGLVGLTGGAVCPDCDAVL